jgi:hypothetical protein
LNCNCEIPGRSKFCRPCYRQHRNKKQRKERNAKKYEYRKKLQAVL